MQKQKRCSTQHRRGTVCAAALLAFTATTLIGCGRQQTPVVIWTDRAELASYTELFNADGKAKAVVVYKDRLADSLPFAKDGERPDVIIGSWLKESLLRRNFRSLNALFSKTGISAGALYQPLLAYGTAGRRQYLLPVSFNLPVVIFSMRNAALIPDNYMLTPDEIRDTAARFNTQNDHGIYTQMGFAPSWENEFLYTVAKLNGAHFTEQDGSLSWDKAALETTVAYIKDWTTQKNTSSSAEQDFAFKYLYTPKYRQVDSGRCLFAYSTSSRLFSISYEQLSSIDFRWVQQNGQIPVEDSIVMAGIYRHSRNTRAAQQFLLWLINADTQKRLLERSVAMHLNTATFGIAGGFSSIRDVNERLFPSYYRTLLGNLPLEAALHAPHSFPSRWTDFKERVVIPYLEDATKTDSKKAVQPMEERIDSWMTQFD